MNADAADLRLDAPLDRLDLAGVEEVHLLLRRSVQKLVELRHVVAAGSGGVERDVVVHPEVESQEPAQSVMFLVKWRKLPLPNCSLS